MGNGPRHASASAPGQRNTSAHSCFPPGDAPLVSPGNSESLLAAASYWKKMPPPNLHCRGLPNPRGYGAVIVRQKPKKTQVAPSRRKDSQLAPDSGELNELIRAFTVLRWQKLWPALRT